MGKCYVPVKNSCRFLRLNTLRLYLEFETRLGRVETRYIRDLDFLSILEGWEASQKLRL